MKKYIVQGYGRIHHWRWTVFIYLTIAMGELPIRNSFYVEQISPLSKSSSAGGNASLFADELISIWIYTSFSLTMNIYHLSNVCDMMVPWYPSGDSTINYIIIFRTQKNLSPAFKINQHINRRSDTQKQYYVMRTERTFSLCSAAHKPHTVATQILAQNYLVSILKHAI